MKNKIILSMLTIGLSSNLVAGPREVAYRMYERIAGIPPSETDLTTMENLIKAGKLKEAALVPVDTETFLSVTVKNMVAFWTNEDEKVDFPLNDYSATVIGYVKDDVSMKGILADDIIYTAQDGLTGVAAYANENNTHYENFEVGNFSYKTQLVQKKQSDVTQLGVAAGVLTTRGFGNAYYLAGTNRAALRFILKTFICKDITQLSDTERSQEFIGRDVSRAPGGDISKFKNECAGCHSGMDGLRPAFAFIDHPVDRNVYTPNVVVAKMNQNSSVYPDGYAVNDDKWTNLWVEGSNAGIGWSGETTGNGLGDFGSMVTNTSAFPNCMAERVFEKVCLRKPVGGTDRATVVSLGDKFKAGGYKMKALFAETAAACLGE